MKTVLKDRTLWFDGTNEIKSEDVLDFVLRNKQCFVCVDKLDKEITQYNKFVRLDEQITTKTHNTPFNFEWKIGDYEDLDVAQYIIHRFDVEILKKGWDLSSEEVKERSHRISLELKIFEKKGLTDLLRVLIYIINTLEQNKKVWGVGRGSSVSSYVLYLLGVHDIDSVLYDINFSDFL